MIIETTNYFASKGNADAVLIQRRKASFIREQLGLDPGQIFIKLEGNGPDVRWECVFNDQEAFDADMKIRAASADFATARKDMHRLVDRFERHLSTPDQRSG